MISVPSARWVGEAERWPPPSSVPYSRRRSLARRRVSVEDAPPERGLGGGGGGASDLLPSPDGAPEVVDGQLELPLEPAGLIEPYRPPVARRENPWTLL